MTNIVSFTLELAQSFYESADEFPIDFDDAWQWLGYAKKQNAKDLLIEYFEESLDFIRCGVKSPNGGRPRESIVLTVDCLKEWGMISKTPQGKLIRRYFLECERIAKLAASTQRQTPQTYLEALKALVAVEEQKVLLEAENTQLRSEVTELSEQVDELFEYSSIIRVAKFNNVHEKKFDWRKLKAASTVKEIEIKQVPCPRFGVKNLYSHDAWRYCYPNVALPETNTFRLPEEQ